MSHYTLRITLDSDTAFGAGPGVHGVVDRDVLYDAWGFPKISGKTINGLLAEAAEQLFYLDIQAGKMTEDAAQRIYDFTFGCTGQADSGALEIDDAVLEGYGDLLKGIKAHPDNRHISPATVLEHYTRTKSQTAIEDGIPAEHSLRKTRVVKKDTAFLAQVQLREVPENLRVEVAALLNDAVRCVRHGGLTRNRGLGALTCSLDPPPSASTIGHGSPTGYCPDDTIDYEGDEEIERTYKLELLSERVSEDDFIPGAAVLGISAGAFLAKNRSITRDNAQDAPSFRALFLEDKVEFSNAYPILEKQASIPTPLSYRLKKDESTYLYDLLKSENIDDSQFAKPNFSFGQPSGNTWKHYAPKTKENLHHKRASNRAIARAQGQGDGEFFSFYSLQPGDVFEGSIRGPATLVHEIERLLNDTDRRSGKSKKVQYGKCRFSGFEKKEPAKTNIDETIEKLPLLLTSDHIYLNDLGQPDPSLSAFCLELSKAMKKFSHSSTIDANVLAVNEEKTFVSIGCDAGFSGQWRMPKARLASLKKARLSLWMYRI